MGKFLEVVAQTSGFLIEEDPRGEGTWPRAFSAQVHCPSPWSGSLPSLLQLFPSWIAFGSRIMLSAIVEITRGWITFRGDSLCFGR